MNARNRGPGAFRSARGAASRLRPGADTARTNSRSPISRGRAMLRAIVARRTLLRRGRLWYRSLSPESGREEALMETLSLTPELEPKVFSSLGSCALFRALKPEQLPQLVKVAELQRYEPGETIVRQGDPSDSFYFVIDATAAVTVTKGDGDPVEIGTIPLPSSVGEVSLLLGEPRTASVTARSQVQALKFSNKAFEAMFQKIPQFGAALAS